MKLQVYIKNVYGNELIYPENEAAQLFTELIRKKTLDRRSIELIKKLGHEIEVISKSEAI